MHHDSSGLGGDPLLIIGGFSLFFLFFSSFFFLSALQRRKVLCFLCASSLYGHPQETGGAYESFGPRRKSMHGALYIYIFISLLCDGMIKRRLMITDNTCQHAFSVQ
ncbi:hypothetical protein LZ30DRAFT_162350 [Colletotrichum cereale]|nr:hypothetical protein LZ30DRAFT_162350 [Colletotrichum cereale]